MTPDSLIRILLLGFAHGSAIVASRAGLQVFAVLTWNWLNFSIASMVFLVTLLISRSWPTQKGIWVHGSVWGITGVALPSILVAFSLNHQSSGLTGVMIAMAPIITCVVAHYFLPDERLTLSKIVGISLSIVGVLIIAFKNETGLPGVSANNLTGLVASFLAVLLGSSSNVYARIFMQNFNVLHAASIRTFASAAAITPFFILSGNFDFLQISPSHYSPLIYALLIGTFSGNIIIFSIVKKYGATTASMAAYIIPIVAIILGMLTLKEEFTSSIALGTALILSGVYFVLRKFTSKALG